MKIALFLLLIFVLIICALGVVIYGVRTLWSWVLEDDQNGNGLVLSAANVYAINLPNEIVIQVPKGTVLEGVEISFISFIHPGMWHTSVYTKIMPVTRMNIGLDVPDSEVWSCTYDAAYESALPWYPSLHTL